MAITDNLYYYFKMRNGAPYQIRTFLVRVNTDINRIYFEMTDEQKAFYLAHPTASVMEVWNCQLTPPYVPPTPDVSEYAAMKVRQLKDSCYASVSVTDLEFAMAIDKMENITADSYYTIAQAREVVSAFRSQSKKAMQVYNNYKPQIESAETIEAIDILYNQAIAAL